jgi:hypothetical protein
MASLVQTTLKVVIVATGLTVFALRPSWGADEGGLECEEAAAHVADCCGTGRINVCGVDTGCDSEPPPTLSAADSACLLEHDCASLVDLGVCERLEQWMTTPSTTDRVCP